MLIIKVMLVEVNLQMEQVMEKVFMAQEMLAQEQVMAALEEMM